MQLAENGFNLALSSVLSAFPLDGQEGRFLIRSSHAKLRRGQSRPQLRMEERGGAPLLVNRAKHRSSSASRSRLGGHDERLRAADGSIAKGTSSTTVGRCVFVCCIEMTGASGALIMWSTPLFGLARRVLRAAQAADVGPEVGAIP